MFKKKIITVVLILALGVILGYFWGSKKSTSSLSVNNNLISSQENDVSGKISSTKAVLKLDLLRDYINFVYLPKEEIQNIQEYVENMGKKVEAIGDEEIREKFQATGNDAEREKRILEFFNFIIDDVKIELSQ
mgnify:CR=1 FL=1